MVLEWFGGGFKVVLEWFGMDSRLVYERQGLSCIELWDAARTPRGVLFVFWWVCPHSSRPDFPRGCRVGGKSKSKLGCWRRW